MARQDCEGPVKFVRLPAENPCCLAPVAPEEPNVYSTAIDRTTRAPAERNVSGNGTQVGLFRSVGARRNFLQLARPINITSLQDGETGVRKILLRKQEAVGLLRRECSHFFENPAV